MNNLVQRTITGIIFLVLVVGAVIFHKLSFFLLFALIIAGSMYEFYSLAERKSYKPQKIFGVILGILFFTANFIYANNYFGVKIFLPLILLLITVYIVELYRKSDQVFVNIGFTLLGIIYIALPLSLANYIVLEDAVNYNWQLLLGFFIITWSFDTFAYIFGVSLGKHRLFERISPKKSWEGFIGGVIFTIIIAYPVSLLFSELNFVHWAIVAILVSVAGTYGDLVESAFKRNINRKDSGNIMPGHGGFLDRFDAILFSLPAFYVFLQIIN